MDAWLAPGGGAVKLSAAAMKMQARWLRRARPRPFGFAPGSMHPVPARIDDAWGASTLSSGVATILGLRTAVYTMSISYGDRDDPRAPAALIISDFHRDYQDRDLEDELRHSASRWGSPARAPDPGPEDSGTRPDIISVSIDVTVTSSRRPLSLLRLREFSAFQFREGSVLVTVLARHLEPQFPGIVRLTDLEPLLSPLEHPDKEAIAAAFAELRRQRGDQSRNQAPES
jgi:hypothetical protein